MWDCRYGTGPEVLDGISFALEAGSFNFLSGASGAGKTSLLRLMYLGCKPTRGLITLFGETVNGMSRDRLAPLRQKIGVVFQDFRLLPHLSAFDNIALPLRIQKLPEKKVRANVDELMDWAALTEWKNVLPPTLSGGQQQRVAIARAVISRPKLLLADEPTGNVDDDIGLRLMSLFEQLNRMGTTIVIATHNTGLATRYAHDRLILTEGRLEVETIASVTARKSA